MRVKRKPWSRAKLSARKREKCVVFPHERYDEFRQPQPVYCQVCNVVVESLGAHLGTPEHFEVMSNLKAAGSIPHTIANPVTDTNFPKANPAQPSDSPYQLLNCSQEVPKHQSSSVLPPGFCGARDKIKIRSVTTVMDPPEEQEHWESNTEPARKKSKVLTSEGKASTPLKSSRPRGRPRKVKITKLINKTSTPPSTPRRSKRIKHVADKTVKNIAEKSSSFEELMKGPAEENSQADVKEVSSDLDSLVIYKRKRLPRTSNFRSLSKQAPPTEPSMALIPSSAAASPPHQDPSATAQANIDAPNIENTNTAEPMLNESHVEEVEKVDPPEANAQEQVASSKNQESPDQVDLKADEVSSVNTPLNLEAINKMIEEDPLSAIENMLTGKVSVSSKTRQSTTTQSGPPNVQGSTTDALSKELKDLIQTFSLGDFFADYQQMSKVLFILDELQKNEKFLSLAQQTFIKNLRLFFHNTVTRHKECDIARMKKFELSQAKEDILLKFQETKQMQDQITMSISNANNRVNEISSYIQQLEEQLSKLKKERETFQLAINECGKQREKFKSDSILWAHQAKDLVFDLAETETQLKTLGEQLEADKDAYVQFKASFPF